MKFEGMIIGVPTEIMHGEGRVSSTPETVKKMVAEGATVLVQKGAGNKCFFSDEEYVAAGATIIDRADFIHFLFFFEGLQYVIIDGKIVLEDGKYNGIRAAKVIRKKA